MKELKDRLAKWEAKLEAEYARQNSTTWTDGDQLMLQALEDDVECLKEEIYGF